MPASGSGGRARRTVLRSPLGAASRVTFLRSRPEPAAPRLSIAASGYVVTRQPARRRAVADRSVVAEIKPCRRGKALPPDCAAAIAVIFHVGSGRSFLPEIFSWHGKLPAVFGEGGAVVEPGRVDVAPSDHHMLAPASRLRRADSRAFRIPWSARSGKSKPLNRIPSSWRSWSGNRHLAAPQVSIGHSVGRHRSGATSVRRSWRAREK